MLRVRIILLGFSLALAVAAAALVWREGGPSQRNEGAQVGGHYRLVDQNGHVRSDEDFRGRWVIVYFGYTWCPDVCPTTLADIAGALRTLGPKARNIVPVFITLDPKRDSPETLRKYLAAFGPQFVGLCGTPGEIAKVAREYHLYYAKHGLPSGSYSVDHANAIFLMAPDGRFVSLLDDSNGAATLAKDLRTRL